MDLQENDTVGINIPDTFYVHIDNKDICVASTYFHITVYPPNLHYRYHNSNHIYTVHSSCLVAGSSMYNINELFSALEDMQSGFTYEKATIIVTIYTLFTVHVLFSP